MQKHDVSSEEITLNSAGETNEEDNSFYEISRTLKLEPPASIPVALTAFAEEVDTSTMILDVIRQDITSRTNEATDMASLRLDAFLKRLEGGCEVFWSKSIQEKDLLEEGAFADFENEDLADSESEAKNEGDQFEFFSFKKRMQESKHKQPANKPVEREKPFDRETDVLKRLMKTEKEKIDTVLFLKNGKQIKHENNKKLYKELKLVNSKTARQKIVQQYLKNFHRSYSDNLQNLKNMQLPLRFHKPHEKTNLLLIDPLTKPEIDELGYMTPKQSPEVLKAFEDMMAGPVYDFLNAFHALKS